MDHSTLLEPRTVWTGAISGGVPILLGTSPAFRPQIEKNILIPTNGIKGQIELKMKIFTKETYLDDPGS